MYGARQMRSASIDLRNTSLSAASQLGTFVLTDEKGKWHCWYLR